MFNKCYEIDYADKDVMGFLKPHVLLNYLSNIATANAAVNKFGYKEVSEKNCGWFVLKYALEFDNYPQSLDEMIIETTPRGANKLFVFRDFVIKNKAGEQLGKVNSTWGLVDFVSMKMVNALEVFAGRMPHYEKNEDDVVFDKIPAITNVTAEKKYEVRYYDIDLNNHLNNTNYLLWAMDVLPVDFLKTNKIKKIDMLFKKELKLGDFALAQVEILDKQTIHVIKNAETLEDSCQIKIEWA